MRKSVIVFSDVVIITLTSFSVMVIWQLISPEIEILFRQPVNYTQTSVTTYIPGSVINYLWPVVLALGMFLNFQAKRYRMAAVAFVGILAMGFTNFLY